ncbi:exodeoxyribonuclease I [Escherichia coli]|uniref:Exodeoxyribonuclease I n=1 Tax=Escherichia coli TaxID=562 RepID=A0A2X1QD99_ECOLX|nr:exodeoxyribonuclease I [Escherichia coli]
MPSSNAGWEHRRQVFTPVFLQGYAEEIQMLAQQYADDKEKVALFKSALAVRGRDCLI